MINYEHFVLDNGLQVYVHEDFSTPMAAFNICYNVGSRDEDPNKTGFAHLFEHLMFGGSKNIPSFDEPLQKVGAQNNAFTSPDITNYYITIPAENIETAFWLESDRMKELSFDPKVLEVQRKVVIEEYKQRYLNQPYGDIWLKLRPLAYEVHPYKWATIGKDISHIENATMDDVKTFFYKHYIPNNAVLVVGGNVKTDQIKKLSEKWFGPIAKGIKTERNLPKEPIQNTKRELNISANVPVNAIYKTFQMPGRYETGFHNVDILSDVLGRGKSSILEENLVKKQKAFSSISAYVMASLDPGLLVISGNLNENISMATANDLINEQIDQIKSNKLSEETVFKAKNQSFASIGFGNVELLNRVMNLAFSANGGNVDACNQDYDKINAISADDINKASNEILNIDKSCTMFYNKN